MDKLTFEILSILKSKYNEIKINTHYQTEDICKEYSARQFYLKTLDENIFEPMDSQTLAEYGNGSGSELRDKMLALRSSSAMTYNIFGNGQVDLCSKKFHKKFEWQFNPLKNAPRPANLDVLLTSQDSDEVYAFEMKMMEWLSNKKMSIREAYLEPKNYFDDESAMVYTTLFKKTSEEYSFKHYEVFQMIKHSLALYNACLTGELNCKKLNLICGYWLFTKTEMLSLKLKEKYTDTLFEFVSEGDAFIKETSPIVRLFKNKGIEFTICNKPFTRITDDISMSDERKNYLKRYTLAP